MKDQEGPAERGKRILEDEEAAEAEATKSFDPEKLIMDAATVQVINDPVLGEIAFTMLTALDMFEIAQCKTAIEQTKETLFRLLRSAYPVLKSSDDILNLPAQTVVRLGEILEGPENFFQIPRRSTPGSKPTETPNTSV